MPSTFTRVTPRFVAASSGPNPMRGAGCRSRLADMTRSGLIGALLVIVAVPAGCGGADKAGGKRQPDVVTLTVANAEPDDSDLSAFAKEVERLSHGTLRLSIKNDWRPGVPDYERRTMDDVRDGTVEMAKVNARVFDLAGVKSFQPLLAPFAVDSYALERRVLHSPLAAPALKGVGALGLVGIALLPGDLRKPVGVQRDLPGPRDFQGATVATRMSALGRQTFEALGAKPAYVAPR